MSRSNPEPRMFLPRYPCAYASRSEEHTSELQSQSNLVCRLLLEKKKKNKHERKTESPNHDRDEGDIENAASTTILSSQMQHVRRRYSSVHGPERNGS